MKQSPPRITAILTARPGKGIELRDLLLTMAPFCRAEPGNLRWNVWRDQAQEGRYVLDESYRDRAAVEAHHQTPHYLQYLRQIPELAERAAFVLNPVDVRPDDTAKIAGGGPTA